MQTPQCSLRDLLSVDGLLLLKETLSGYLCALQGPFTFMTALKLCFSSTSSKHLSLLLYFIVKQQRKDKKLWDRKREGNRMSMLQTIIILKLTPSGLHIEVQITLSISFI